MGVEPVRLNKKSKSPTKGERRCLNGAIGGGGIGRGSGGGHLTGGVSSGLGSGQLCLLTMALGK
ncbi:hypothetical protein JCGZ_12176 [Jatropha curcas]|uniref:Uncharacterized protein n=1 Tax=Jatropha curcas TaxID=180498 RepID=A0A067KM54_JATCU|nr:hypothetical protein JCGZ_12176 [Jatropha curcas]